MEKIMTWIDDRFPLTKVWNEHMAKYYAPKNFNFWYFFGSLSLIALVMQIFTGIFLTMHYKPDAATAFASVEYIMRDVPWGWLIRYMHSTGASMFFIVVYLHMFRALLYGSFRSPRELVWWIGMIIFIALMAESFMGYLLPWGNMSYWGAQVIINLFEAIPVIGPGLSEWVRGDFVISDATLNRFFAFHVILVPLALAALAFVHIVALHKVGSNNPDGIEIKKLKDENGVPLDGVPFHPYYSVDDIFGIVIYLIIFSVIVFFAPEFGGWFLEKDNFTPANVLQTPPHIVPLWYFTPYYSVLRAVTESFMPYIGVLIAIGVVVALFSTRSMIIRALAVLIGGGMIIGLYMFDAKFWGVIMMGLSLVLFFFLPYLDKSPVKSIRYKGWMYKTALTLFAIAFVVLGYLGTKHPDHTDLILLKNVTWAQIGLFIYFGFFLLMPIYTKLDKTKPVPERVTMK